MLHVLRKCLVIRECTNKKKLFVLVANMKCQCTAMAHRADPQAHRGGRGTMTILRGGGGGPQAAHHIWQPRSRKVNNDEPDLRFFYGNF